TMKARKIIIPVSIIAGIAAIGAAVAALSSSASSVSYAETSEIQLKTLENTISVGGTVESSESRKVYSKLMYPVEKINVSVGDSVKKGDVLCTINTEELQQQILQQQASVESSGISSDYNLSEAEERYTEALEKYQNGENSALINAQKAIDQAEKALEDAKRQEKLGISSSLPINIQSAEANLQSAKNNYDNAVKAYDKAVKELEPENYPANVRAVVESIDEYKESLRIVENHLYNAELESAYVKYNTAKGNYTTAKENMSDGTGNLDELQEAYTAAKQEYETLQSKYNEDNLKKQIETAENQLESMIEGLEAAKDSAEISVENAKLAYDKAAADLDNVKDQNSNTEESYGIAVKNAEDALATAKSDYENAVKQVESELSSLKKQAEQQRTISGLNDPQVIILQNLRDKLEYAVVTAPCDGVVTSVRAEEGLIAEGPLFVIEDLDDLKISSMVGEYDISGVNEGMTATIRCDALNGAEYGGKVITVSPTSDAAASATGVNYKIETEVDDEDGKLRVGMSAKVDIVSERKENVLTITYDSLATDADGNDAVYIAEKGEDGVWRARLVTVEIGLETDYEIEVISSELKSGMLVLTDTALLSDGAVVMINEEAENSETTAEQVTEE
ncbi:MAG: efflux RND transporter periplasmic adaptor subunit, partial [Oscillospiraceae bacterium]|nr:efflux RND transporter periplasmic adaptor subunit [Oscillospiraceae bacterium]